MALLHRQPNSFRARDGPRVPIQKIGSLYIWQALTAQRFEEGYHYGGWEKLAEDHQNGWHSSDYNLKDQRQIAQDFYDNVLVTDNLARLAF